METRKWVREKDLEQLRTDGYLRIEGVIPQPLVDAAVRDIHEHLGADPQDSETWYNGLPENDGIVPLHHAQSLWDIRQCPNLYAVFSDIWGTEELFVDINRCCFRPPWSDRAPTVSRGFIHWDIDPRVGHIDWYQGIVLLTDVSRNGGGYLCVPEIYRNLDTWLAENAAGSDFDSDAPGIPIEDATQIEGRAGDYILWSTLLPHGTSPNLSGKPRLGAYVSMGRCDNPFVKSSQAELWKTKRIPTAWNRWRGAVDPEPGDPATLTPLGEKLIGLVPW